MQVRRESRMVIAFWLISLCLIILILRLSYIQLEQNVKLTRMALARDTMAVSLEEFPRGEILDRNGSSLTGSFKVNRVVVFPAAVKDMDTTINKLSQILEIKPDSLIPYLQGKPRYLPFDLMPGQAELIRSLGNGVTVLPVKQRYGPDPVAVHITGYLGKIQSEDTFKAMHTMSEKEYHYDDWVGVTGLEKYYEHQLKGEFPVSRASMYMDAQERIVSQDITLLNNNQIDPNRYNIVTTIDLQVQQVVERVMDRRVEKGAVVVIQPHSGDIIACASRPDFNNNPLEIPAGNIEKEVFLNRAVSLFQPGSLFKLVLASAALEEGIAVEETKFLCDGAMDSPIRCWYPHGHGEISLHEAVVNSCNPAFVQLGQKMGADMIVNYAEKLGLSNENIIGLPEKENTRQNLQAITQPYNLANSSIGQGPVLSTPVQLTAMMNTIASEGVYYAPRIVGQIESRGEELMTFHASPGSRVMSQSTAGTLQRMLEGVTGTGVGGNAFVEPGGSAGKTGSAQVSNQSGGYINAWFSGYVPVENPRYVITVLVQEGESGGETAAPIFKEIARELLRL